MCYWIIRFLKIFPDDLKFVIVMFIKNYIRKRFFPSILRSLLTVLIWFSRNSNFASPILRSACFANFVASLYKFDIRLFQIWKFLSVSNMWYLCKTTFLLFLQDICFSRAYSSPCIVSILIKRKSNILMTQPLFT